jgi:hypothetical protein
LHSPIAAIPVAQVRHVSAEYRQAVVPSHIDMESTVLEQSVIFHSYLQVSRLHFCYSSW